MTQWTHKLGFSLETLPEKVAVSTGAGRLAIGIPAEISPTENRVSLVPHSVKLLVMQGHRVMVQAGAGIVADSKPEHEYAETVNKARAMFRAIEMAERGL